MLCCAGISCYRVWWQDKYETNTTQLMVLGVVGLASDIPLLRSCGRSLPWLAESSS